MIYEPTYGESPLDTIPIETLKEYMQDHLSDSIQDEFRNSYQSSLLDLVLDFYVDQCSELDVKDYLSENDRIYDILRSINEDDKDYPVETDYDWLSKKSKEDKKTSRTQR